MGDMSEGRRFTRRDALSGAATAGAGVLLGPGVARAAARSAGPGAGRVFAHELGRLRAGVSAPVEVGRAFCLAAVRWSAPAHAHIELRTRRPAGGWGRWTVASSCGHDGDGARSRRQVGEGVWTGRASALQLRSSSTVRDVDLVLVAAEPGDAGHGAGGPAAADLRAYGRSDALALAGPQLPAGPGQPPIIARGVWAGAHHPPVGGPVYAAIEMGIVHHTENANGYPPGAVPAMLRAIYAFHVHGRGWFDIGYNFVIDRFGRIWEARQGGIDLPVVGAQAGDWNQISFGVSLLGTYSDVVPSAAALASLRRLLAWKLALNGLPATGEIDVVVPAANVSYTQFRAGAHVHFPRVAGHRDVDSTDCPGTALYDQLPGLRPSVARLLGTPATLSVAATLSQPAGGPGLLALSGRLARAGRPIAGAPVAVQAVVGRAGDTRAGDTRTLATATTDAGGNWTATTDARPGLLVRAVHAPRPAVVSALLSVDQSIEAAGTDVLG